MWPHGVESWFRSWYRGRVETLDAKYNLAHIISTLCGYTSSSKRAIYIYKSPQIHAHKHALLFPLPHTHTHTQMGEGTPRLLDNVERYALYQARTVNDTDPERRLWKRDNISKDGGSSIHPYQGSMQEIILWTMGG